jgi:homoserine O-acetyltransferase
VTGRLVVVGVDSDRLYPVRLSDEIAATAPNAESFTVTSPYGHDGFLIETEQVGSILRRVVGRRAEAGEIR